MVPDPNICTCTSTELVDKRCLMHLTRRTPTCRYSACPKAPSTHWVYGSGDYRIAELVALCVKHYPMYVANGFVDGGVIPNAQVPA